jgi:hypothetical protein
MLAFLVDVLINVVCLGMIGLLFAFIIDHILATRRPHRH